VNFTLKNTLVTTLKQYRVKENKTWLIFPMLAYTKYDDGSSEFFLGWLRKTWTIKLLRNT
jgi:hypothetical protein